VPQPVKASADLLSESVERYVFISSQSVYADVSAPGVDESAPLKSLTPEEVDKANAINESGQGSAAAYGAMYGGLKVLCEQAAEEAMPNRVLVIRPGLIVGPYDYTDRFTYWPMRVARGGEVLAPGRPDQFVQLIDARDLAEWMVKMVEQKETGIYNANCPPNIFAIKDVLDECKTTSGSDASFTWADEEFLLKENLHAWSEMPLWLPEDAAPHLKGFMFINCDKAFAAGLTSRPLSETIRDTLEWHRTQSQDEQLKAGISSDREMELLKKWHEAHQ
jgi:2'-hydroxyisoflavone reductase